MGVSKTESGKSEFRPKEGRRKATIAKRGTETKREPRWKGRKTGRKKREEEKAKEIPTKTRKKTGEVEKPSPSTKGGGVSVRSARCEQLKPRKRERENANGEESSLKRDGSSRRTEKAQRRLKIGERGSKDRRKGKKKDATVGYRSV
jgi:hypothetical protein